MRERKAKNQRNKENPERGLSSIRSSCIDDLDQNPCARRTREGERKGDSGCYANYLGK